MRKNSCLIFLLASIFAALSCGGSRHPSFNVILISIDSLRAGHLSCYGYHRKTSPAIDELAKESLLFKKAYSQSANTKISHMSILTSSYPSVHRIQDFSETGPLSSKIKTLAEILKSHDYQTIGIYDCEVQLGPQYGFGRGFDGYMNYRKIGYSASSIMNLLPNTKDRPFFLFVHYFDVHCSDLENSQFVYDGPPEFRDKFTKAMPVHSPIDIWYGNVEISAEELEAIIARYDGGILHVDSQLNELFNSLKSKGIFDNSLIIITADHGESLGYKETMKSHGWLYEIGTHVPLIIKLPKNYSASHAPHKQTDFVVRTIDILPTILQVLSIESPPYINGISLLANTGDRNDYAALSRCYSIKSNSSKILVFENVPKNTNASFMRKSKIELYDLLNDPDEMNNLYGKDDERLRKLLLLAEDMKEEARLLRADLADDKAEPITLNKQQIDELEALGYLR